MHIRSDENITVYNHELKEDVVIEIGQKYIINPGKATNRKDRKNKGRIVEVLGFHSDFMPDVIIRYMDTKRRGRVNPCDLIKYNNDENESITNI